MHKTGGNEEPLCRPSGMGEKAREGGRGELEREVRIYAVARGRSETGIQICRRCFGNDFSDGGEGDVRRYKYILQCTVLYMTMMMMIELNTSKMRRKG